MSAIEMRDDIYKWAEQVDESFLSAVHAIMGAYVEKQEQEDQIVGYRISSGEALSVNEADEEFEAIVDEVRRGEYLTVEEMIEQRSQRW
ncbi:MAG: hypothetical protein AAF741_05055 [Bacteroidota bacterium]